MYNLDEISFFLNCGFLPRYQEGVTSNILPENNVEELQQNRQGGANDESAVIEKGIRAFKSSFKNLNGDVHIVPLSGGLDSRAILAGLIDAGIQNRIITVTFGQPGAYDYEIGSALSRKLGLRHESFDLTSIKVDANVLLETARNGSAWTFLIDAFYNSQICREFGTDAIYWSGFIGGELAGSHLPPAESRTWSEAIRYFVKWNRFPNSGELSRSDYNPEKSLPSSPLIHRSNLSYDDQLDFVIRQQNYIKRVVMFEGYDYRTPFLAADWVDFILNVPRRYRVNKYIFKKILLKAFPKLFSFPTTNNYGSSLRIPRSLFHCRRILSGVRERIDKNHRLIGQYFDPLWRFMRIYQTLNYIDFDDALRKRPDFKSLVYDTIEELKQRNILDWLDLDLIMMRHQKKITNHGFALMLLVSLEISLKVSETEPSKGTLNKMTRLCDN